MKFVILIYCIYFDWSETPNRRWYAFLKIEWSWYKVTKYFAVSNVRSHSGFIINTSLWVERAAKFAESEVRSYIRSIRNTSLWTKCAGKFTVSQVWSHIGFIIITRLWLKCGKICSKQSMISYQIYSPYKPKGGVCGKIPLCILPIGLNCA